jgi:hypothetical protein
MKFNQWTLGLAAVGVISYASAVQAEESAVPLMTALSATTISGYVDTSAQWNFGTGTGGRVNSFSAGKSDGFNLNVVQVSLGKAMEATDEWAAGYQVDLWMGPDANALGTDSTGVNTGDFALRQAYVALRAPVGNGLDFKVGVFDTIVGYESLESGKNPNYTRSYGFTIEPTTHTGVLMSYRFTDCISMSAGIANTANARINQRANPPKAESYKTYMGSVALTAPESWGFLAGSTLYAGVVNGFDSGNATGGVGNETSWYVGSTFNTPIDSLKLGVAWDLLDYHSNSSNPTPGMGDAWAASVYASLQATEKLSLHVRGELGTLPHASAGGSDNIQAWALTGTMQLYCKHSTERMQ